MKRLIDGRFILCSVCDGTGGSYEDVCERCGGAGSYYLYTQREIDRFRALKVMY